MNQAIVIRSYRETDYLHRHLLKLLTEVSDWFDIHILYDNTNKAPLNLPNAFNFSIRDYENSGFPLVNNEQYSKLAAANSSQVLPSSRPMYYNCEYSILLWRQSDLANRDYDFVWSIEDDVTYSGHWKNFFDLFDVYPVDCFGAFLKKYPGKGFFPDYFKTYNWEINDLHKIGFFGPVMRYSKAALDLAEKEITEGKHAYYETLIPSLCAEAGLSYMDMWRLGQLHNRKYYDWDTFGGHNIPAWKLAEFQQTHKELLFHPVREEIF